MILEFWPNNRSSALTSCCLSLLEFFFSFFKFEDKQCWRCCCLFIFNIFGLNYWPLPSEFNWFFFLSWVCFLWHFVVFYLFCMSFFCFLLFAWPLEKQQASQQQQQQQSPLSPPPPKVPPPPKLSPWQQPIIKSSTSYNQLYSKFESGQQGNSNTNRIGNEPPNPPVRQLKSAPVTKLRIRSNLSAAEQLGVKSSSPKVNGGIFLFSIEMLLWLGMVYVLSSRQKQILHITIINTLLFLCKLKKKSFTNST